VRKLLVKAVFHDPRLADDAWVGAVVSAWGPRDRRRAYMATGFALRRSDASVHADLERLRVPTLVLSGREDAQFSWRSAEDASCRIPGARFGAIESAGHFPMVERPEETVRLLAGFLDG
jgi:pimeloyl-ACP methyl ester carboxylesterase